MPNDFLSPELQAIEREHRRDVRMVTARPFFVRVIFGLLVMIDLTMLLFFSVVIIGYLIQGSFNDVRAVALLDQNTQAIHAFATQNAEKKLSIGTAKVLQGTATSYDFYALVKNPYPDWYATFTMTFAGNGVTERQEKGFVLPGEEKYLISFGNVAKSRPSSVRVQLRDVVWQRVDRHFAPNVQEWMNEHDNFTVTNVAYVTDIGLINGSIGRTSFTLANTTPYSYWTPQFTVILERAGAVIGLAQATVSAFASGEKREVEVRWYGEQAMNASVTVVPNIHYFDAAVFMPPLGMDVADPRDQDF